MPPVRSRRRRARRPPDTLAHAADGELLGGAEHQRQLVGMDHGTVVGHPGRAAPAASGTPPWRAAWPPRPSRRAPASTPAQPPCRGRAPTSAPPTSRRRPAGRRSTRRRRRRRGRGGGRPTTARRRGRPSRSTAGERVGDVVDVLGAAPVGEPEPDDGRRRDTHAGQRLGPLVGPAGAQLVGRRRRVDRACEPSPSVTATTTTSRPDRAVQRISPPAQRISSSGCGATTTRRPPTSGGPDQPRHDDHQSSSARDLDGGGVATVVQLADVHGEVGDGTGVVRVEAQRAGALGGDGLVEDGLGQPGDGHPHQLGPPLGGPDVVGVVVDLASGGGQQASWPRRRTRRPDRRRPARTDRRPAGPGRPRSAARRWARPCQQAATPTPPCQNPARST